MPISYTMTNSAGGKFSLSGTKILVAGALAAGVSTVTIQAADGNGWSKTQNIEITVTDPSGGGGLPADPNRYMFASTRLVPPTRLSAPSSNQLSRLSRVYAFSPDYTVTELRLVYQNFWMDPSGGNSPENDPGNALVIDGSSVEIAGTFYRVTFNGGSNTASITDGGTLISDPISVILPPLTQYWIRTIDTVSGGQARPAGMDRSSASLNGYTEGLEYDALASNLTGKIMTGTVGLVSGSGGTNTGYVYGPSFAIGKGGWDGRPVVLIHGDSMMSPANDNVVWADQYGCFGWGPRGLFDNSGGAQRVPFANLALFGSRPSNRSSRAPNNYQRTGQQFDAIKAINGGKVPFTAVLSEHINNDASAGITGTALMTIMQNWWAFLRSEYPEAKIIQTAAMPASSMSKGPPLNIPTDYTNWTNIGSQLFRTDDAIWPAANAGSISGSRWWVSTSFIASPPATVDAVIDQTALLSGTDYGKWKPPAFSAVLTADSAANSSVLYLDTAPEVGEALVVEPGNSNVTGPGAFFVKSVAGAGPYAVTMFTGSVNPHAAGSVVKAAGCGDGVHASPRTHMRLAQAIIDAKAAGKFGGAGSGGGSSGASGGTWLLTTGNWNDAGVWDDTAAWKDS